MTSLALVFGAAIRSVNVMGKAGGLQGRRGGQWRGGFLRGYYSHSFLFMWLVLFIIVIIIIIIKY